MVVVVERIQAFASGQTIDLSDPRLPPRSSLDGMAFWPADSRENVLETSKHSRKKARWEYPFVTEGSLTATTLTNKAGKFEWTHVLQDKGRSASIMDKSPANDSTKG